MRDFGGLSLYRPCGPGSFAMGTLSFEVIEGVAMMPTKSTRSQQHNITVDDVADVVGPVPLAEKRLTYLII